MKKSKLTKVLLTVLCAALLVAGSVLGTLAYLTDRSSVENTFTVGNVDIEVDEKDVDENGVPVEGADRVYENDYHLIPGQTYVKDPTMTVKAGSEESYVRMLVTVNNYAELLKIQEELKATYPDKAETFVLTSYINGLNPTQWQPFGKTEDTDANTATYEFRYYQTVDASAETEDIVLPALFESITVPGEVNAEQLATLKDFKLTAEGHAIQTATFADADAAWAAFDAQFKAESANP